MEHPGGTSDEQELVREAEETRRARALRLKALTPEERVERLHALCAQVAALRSSASNGSS